MAMGSPRRGHGRRRAPMAEINVTPLVDVMLVLLIIFMVTAPLLVAGVPVNLPEAQAKALETEQEPVAVTLDAEGRTYLGEEAVTEEELATRLATLGARDPAPQVYLRADGALDYARVMRVMGALNAAGLNRVSLVTIQAGGQAGAGRR